MFSCKLKSPLDDQAASIKCGNFLRLQALNVPPTPDPQTMTLVPYIPVRINWINVDMSPKICSIVKNSKSWNVNSLRKKKIFFINKKELFDDLFLRVYYLLNRQILSKISVVKCEQCSVGFSRNIVHQSLCDPFRREIPKIF